MFFRKTPQFYKILESVRMSDTARADRTTIQLMTHQEELLKALAEQTGGSRIEVLRRIVDDWTESNCSAISQ